MYYGLIWHSWFTLFGSMFKRFSYDPLLDSERSIAVTIMFSIFLFLNTVVLYNLIVSIVVSFNKKMKALSQMKLDTGRAIMVVELETAIPKRFLKKLEKPYIHFLRLLPPEDIDLDRLWLNVGYSEEIQESLKEAMTRRLHRAENEIMSEIEVSCKLKHTVNSVLFLLLRICPIGSRSQFKTQEMDKHKILYARNSVVYETLVKEDLFLLNEPCYE